MRVVVDTNILVRALLNPDGSVGPVVDSLREGRYVFLYSDATLNELIEVLGRPRMVNRYGITAAEVEALCAPVAGRADVIVTADEDPSSFGC